VASSFDGDTEKINHILERLEELSEVEVKTLFEKQEDTTIN
jgi:hypothetical protein